MDSMIRDKAQHDVMVIMASNVKCKAASFHIKTELAAQRARQPVAIVLKSLYIPMLLQNATSAWTR